MVQFYLIAGLNLKIETDNEYDYFNKRMSEYKTEESECDICVTMTTVKDKIQLPSGVRIYRSRLLQFYEANGKVGYFIHSKGGTIACIVSADEDFKNIDIKLYDDSFANPDEPARRLFSVLGMAIEMGIVRHNRIVLHSSCIRYKDVSLAFSAPPETGKSTHSRLWGEVFGEKVTVINDDKPILSFEDGKVIAHGTPWAGSSGINNNVSAPLKGVVFLAQAKKNRIIPINGIEAIRLIIEETPKPVIPKLMDTYMTMATKLIDRVQCYALECNISSEAVYTVYDEIID